jgi:DNA invertase Pin-like site-specific DNA recombinase
MLTLFFAFAEREKSLISIRTKAALEVAKERGKLLGTANPLRKSWTDSARQKALDTVVDNALSNENSIRAFQHARQLLTTETYRKVSERLNQNKFATPTGKGSWSAGSVYKLVKRMGG